MPVYVYRASSDKSCDYCRNGFEVRHGINFPDLKVCPECGAVVSKVFLPFSIGCSNTSLDRRAMEHGFHKLKRVDKGKYEKLY